LSSYSHWQLTTGVVSAVYALPRVQWRRRAQVVRGHNKNLARRSKLAYGLRPVLPPGTKLPADIVSEDGFNQRFIKKIFEKRLFLNGAYYGSRCSMFYLLT